MNLGHKHDNNLALEKKELISANDRQLQQNLLALKKSRKTLTNLSKMMEKAFDLPVNHGRTFCGRLLNMLVPKRFHRFVPDFMLQVMLEEGNSLEVVARLMREYLNNNQEALRDLAAAGNEKQTQIDELMRDLEQAREENWNAQCLQDYVAEKVNLQIYQEVSDLLDSEFHMLSDEEKEKRKEDLLKQLSDNVEVGNSLMKTLGRILAGGLRVFHRGAMQFYSYSTFYPAIAAVQQSAAGMAETSQAMYAGKDAIMITFRKSLEAIELSIEAASMIDKYAICAPDMKNLLETGAGRIENRLKMLEASSSRTALPPPPKKNKRLVEAKAQTVES